MLSQSPYRSCPIPRLMKPSVLILLCAMLLKRIAVLVHGIYEHVYVTHSVTHGAKPPILQLLKNFPAFYGTRRFTTVVDRVLHLSLS
jgi:hypothetical protein